jgi:hypothetical protein
MTYTQHWSDLASKQQPTLADRLRGAFPGLVDDSETNGADLVQWLSAELEQRPLEQMPFDTAPCGCEVIDHVTHHGEACNEFELVLDELWESAIDDDMQSSLLDDDDEHAELILTPRTDTDDSDLDRWVELAPRNDVLISRSLLFFVVSTAFIFGAIFMALAVSI